MSLIPHEFIFRGDLSAIGPFHSQVFVDALAAGEIVSYYVEAEGVSGFSGDWYIGLKKNGVDILTAGERPQITAMDLEVEVTGLTEAVSFRDRLVPTIDERGAGTITGPITVIVWIKPTEKTTPVDADTFAIADSAASSATKRLSWANIKATLLAYFDTAYVALTGNQTIAGIKTFSSSPIVPTPTGSTDAANKTYVDAAIAGLSWKQKVRAATTGAGTLATSFENGDTIDGVVLATDDRILIKDQASATENGIYVVASSGAPARATDADSGAELVNASVFVSEGTVNADRQYVCTTNAAITIGVTNITFAQFASGGSLADGDYGDVTISSSGTAINVDNNAITYAKMQDISATKRVLGRNTAGSGDTEEVTISQLLDWLGSAAQGDVIYRGAAGWSLLPAGVSGRFLKTQGAAADPIWAAIAGGGDLLSTNNLSDLANAGTARTNLGVAIGSNVQAWDADLDTWATKTPPSGTAVGTSDAQTLSAKKWSLTPSHGSDDTYEGLQIPGLNNSGGVTQWDAVYLNSSSVWVIGDANGSSTYPALGLAVSTETNGNPVTVLTFGTVRNDAWTWTPGGLIYLSTTAGGLTQTAPSTSGDKVQVMGVALDADRMFVNPQLMYITIT